MVSSTLCSAVHILGSQNVYGRAEGIADHYWPWAVFYKSLSFSINISFGLGDFTFFGRGHWLNQNWGLILGITWKIKAKTKSNDVKRKMELKKKRRMKSRSRKY